MPAVFGKNAFLAGGRSGTRLQRYEASLSSLASCSSVTSSSRSTTAPDSPTACSVSQIDICHTSEEVFSATPIPSTISSPNVMTSTVSHSTRRTSRSADTVRPADVDGASAAAAAAAAAAATREMEAALPPVFFDRILQSPEEIVNWFWEELKFPLSRYTQCVDFYHGAAQNLQSESERQQASFILNFERQKFFAAIEQLRSRHTHFFTSFVEFINRRNKETAKGRQQQSFSSPSGWIKSNGTLLDTRPVVTSATSSQSTSASTDRVGVEDSICTASPSSDLRTDAVTTTQRWSPRDWKKRRILQQHRSSRLSARLPQRGTDTSSSSQASASSAMNTHAQLKRLPLPSQAGDFRTTELASRSSSLSQYQVMSAVGSNHDCRNSREPHYLSRFEPAKHKCGTISTIGDDDTTNAEFSSRKRHRFD